MPGVASFSYRRYVSATGMKRRCWGALRDVLIKLLDDPPCFMSIADRELKLPLSHSLPDNVYSFPFFDRLPRRLSNFVHATSEHFTCIDVGANIGGTVAFFGMQEHDVFLAIEPNSKFRQYLTENWGLNENMTILPYVCSSTSGERKFTVHERRGTASLLESENGTAVSTKTLDEIVGDHPEWSRANVLKIDTDGHDFDVIIGSERLLAQNRPAVLFECDVFGNKRYVQDCLETLGRFHAHGYESLLLYDNFGSLMGKYSLADLTPVRSLLFYQLTSGSHYFDVLVMREGDIERFYEREVEYFAGAMTDEELQSTAKVAAALMR